MSVLAGLARLVVLLVAGPPLFAAGLSARLLGAVASVVAEFLSAIAEAAAALLEALGG